MDLKQNFEVIWHAAGYANAELIKMYLESYEINVLIIGESVGSAYGLLNTPLGEVDILVPKNQVDEAKKILEEFIEYPSGSIDS